MKFIFLLFQTLWKLEFYFSERVGTWLITFTLTWFLFCRCWWYEVECFCVGSHAWFISKRHISAWSAWASAVCAKSPCKGRLNAAARWTAAHPHANAGCSHGSRDASNNHASATHCHGTTRNTSAAAAASVWLSGDQWLDTDCTHVACRH